tara:strand:- start:2550 stop:3557 length:1008 start_codon:yes stop_codon:yes gene_type:complete
MTGKFYETHFDDYLKCIKKKNLHPTLCREVYSNLPEKIENLPNMIIYGAKGIGKYTQVLNMLQKYSPSNLKYEKKLLINFQSNKSHFFYKISDIHIEIDMALLGCNAKILWNEIYNQLIDVASVKCSKMFIIVCKNFQEIHSELLENFYSYMQTTYYISVKLVYIILSEQISFIPDNIVSISKIIPIERPNKTQYTKCLGKKMNNIDDISTITNIKNINSNVPNLMLPHQITCNKLLTLIQNQETFSFSQLRDLCYDIFIYNLDIYECIWYILKDLIVNKLVDNKDINDILITTFKFFKYYNNNYRPIYHLENYILYLISKIYGYKSSLFNFKIN